MKFFINNKQSDELPPLQYHDSLFTENSDKANVFNDYFYEQTIIDDVNVNVPLLEEPDKCMDNILLTPQDISDVLKKLKLGKAMGADLINNHVLRELAIELSVPLCNLYNKSLSLSKLPSSWKEANVCVIHKSGDKSIVSNYRPVSLLCSLEKVFERCVFKYVYNFFLECNTITRYQSGFTPGDSTVNQLAYFYNFISKSVDSGKEVKAIFCDISKAFDRVWHKGLLIKLKAAGITGNLLLWFEDYLLDRRQCVVLQGVRSNPVCIRVGVPQGSILGPILFLLYINDIVDNIESHIRLFADDTGLFITIDDPVSASNILNRDLLKISNWADKWLVKFNPVKTKSLLFSRKITPVNHPPVQMNNVLIADVEDHKHLGIFFSRDLSWHTHIDYITEKAWNRIHVMKRLKFLLDRSALETIYTSFIRPLLEYGDVIFDNCNAQEKLELDKIQNEAARIVCGATKLVSIDNLSNETGWESLETRRCKHKLILFYKMINGISPNYLQELIPVRVGNISSYSLRNAKASVLTRIHTIPLFYHQQYEWNTLSDEIKNSQSISGFKNALNADRLKAPHHFYHGERKYQIFHARLRTNCSPLNSTLFNKNIVETPLCTCGLIEDADHYFFHCHKYNDARVILYNELYYLQVISLDLLLFGDLSLSCDANIKIVDAVHCYIKSSNRFDIH